MVAEADAALIDGHLAERERNAEAAVAEADAALIDGHFSALGVEHHRVQSRKPTRP